MNLFDVAFLIIPVAAIAAREFFGLKVSLPTIFLAFLAVGWGLVNLSMGRYFAALDELVRSTPHPSEELLEKWRNDGARRVFALYSGWALAAVYFAICLPLVYVARGLRRRTGGSGRSETR